jgi:hypothetical protein
MFESMVLRRIFGTLKGRKGREPGENYIMRNFIICKLH